MQTFINIGEWIEKVLDLQERNDELTTERNQLREQVRFKSVLERVNGHIFIQGDDEEICPRCAEADSKAVHLISVHPQHPPYQKAGCPNCKLEMSHNIPYTRALAGRVVRP
jgi:hypothetical protein